MKTNRLFYKIPLLALVFVLVACASSGIAGIDHEIRESGMTFQFYSVTMTTSPTLLGDHTFSPDAGDTALIVHGYYTGNFDEYQNKVQGRNEGLFVITDGQGNKWVRSAVVMGSSGSKLTMDIAFLVPLTSSGPYILSSNIGKTWSVDITSLVNNQSKENKSNLTPTVTADKLTILKANGYSEVENNSLFFCPDGCKVLRNANTNITVAIKNNGSVIFGISPLGSDVTLSNDQLNGFASVIGLIYGPDMVSWLQNTLQGMKATLGYSGHSVGSVNGSKVELQCEWNEGKTNVMTITIDPATQP
jgi:hypothetical protein